MGETGNSGKGTAVIAVGGNSLIVNEARQSIPDQYEAAVDTVRRIVDIVADGWTVVITHGSGPQVGTILRRAELAAGEVAREPMDYADAEIQGELGYMFQRALHNEFRRRGMDRHAVAVVTQVLVDAADPAFAHPTKPIGPFLAEAAARARAEADGWAIAEDAGRGWRRVVPSPMPVEILELEQIRYLLAGGHVAIACGGGGIPVTRNAKGDLVGIEAVIDKDLASGLLATGLGAELFLVSTAVERVAVSYGTAAETWREAMTLAEARTLYDAGEFDPGSMGPKVLAMIRYLEAGGKRGAITDPAHLGAAAAGAAGTQFTRD